MLILDSILQYSFIFRVKFFFFEKNNFPNISTLYFWNYFMPNCYLATVFFGVDYLQAWGPEVGAVFSKF
jgi:hypothetical protein